MTYLYIKALHIIFVVTWFAGLFYMVRLFIYSVEANEKDEPEKGILLKQLLIMQNRLWYIITWPSAVLTFIFGFWLVYELNAWLIPWMLLKFLFVAGLFVYHLICGKIHIQNKNGLYKYSSSKLRIWNEVATLFLFAIVFLVVLKSMLSWVWGLVGLVLISALLMLGIKLYKKLRKDEN
ncbi:MAG: CopD family protein [Cyclobacteriaceae bacterium]